MAGRGKVQHSDRDAHEVMLAPEAFTVGCAETAISEVLCPVKVALQALEVRWSRR